MFEPEQIEKEVKKIFGKDVKVHIMYEPDFDGQIIKVYKRVGNELMISSARIASLEYLEAYHPDVILKQFIRQMYEYSKQELMKKKEVEHANLRNERWSIGREGQRKLQ